MNPKHTIGLQAVARGVSDASGAILAPSINYGMSHHHESFPGTVTLRPATFVAVMRDVASSLSKAGFTHVLFINGECHVSFRPSPRWYMASEYQRPKWVMRRGVGTQPCNLAVP